MGNRGSISIDGCGVVLFRHWSGDSESLVELCEKLRGVIDGTVEPPFKLPKSYKGRQDGDVMGLLIALAVVEDGYSSYVGVDPGDGDNGDNGHFTLNLDTWEISNENGFAEKIKPS